LKHIYTIQKNKYYLIHKMAPRDNYDRNQDFVEGEQESDEEVGEEELVNIADANDRRAFMAAVRREERDFASREMRRQNELRDELQNSVEAMEIMIQSQQRIDVLTRSLQELRELHREMVEAGIGQGDDDDDEDSDDEEEEEELEKPMSLTEDEELFDLEDDDVIDSLAATRISAADAPAPAAASKTGSNPISSAFSSALSPSSKRKHGHT